MLNLKSDPYTRAVSKASLLSPACTQVAGTLDFLVASTRDTSITYLVTLSEPGILEDATCNCPAGQNEQPSCVHRARAYLYLSQLQLCRYCHRPASDAQGLIRESDLYAHPDCSEIRYELVTEVSIPDSIPTCSNCGWADPLPGLGLCEMCLFESVGDFDGAAVYRTIYGR